MVYPFVMYLSPEIVFKFAAAPFKIYFVIIIYRHVMYKKYIRKRMCVNAISCNLRFSNG